MTIIYPTEDNLETFGRLWLLNLGRLFRRLDLIWHRPQQPLALSDLKIEKRF
jgi:hypothetical protein